VKRENKRLEDTRLTCSVRDTHFQAKNEGGHFRCPRVLKKSNVNKGLTIQEDIGLRLRKIRTYENRIKKPCVFFGVGRGSSLAMRALGLT